MVQKFQSPVRVYKYPFELVMKVCILFAVGVGVGVGAAAAPHPLFPSFTFILIGFVGVWGMGVWKPSKRLAVAAAKTAVVSSVGQQQFRFLHLCRR